MLSLCDNSARLCDDLPRRAFLSAGSLSALGLALPPGLKGAEAAARTSGGRAKRCIVLFLLGGPPQHSTWDPKPSAPEEIRGAFGPIATNLPGVQISELMPQTAGMMDKLAVLRAVVTGDNAHSSSGYYMMTGVPHIPKQQENVNPGPPNDWPTMGAVVQSLAAGPHLLPPAVRLPMHIFNTDGSIWPGQDSGWLGHAADPWLFNCEPASPDFDVPQFRLSADVSTGRMSERRTLLEAIESRLQDVERDNSLATYAGQQRRAFDLLSTSQARAAFDLKQEADATRDRYGRSQFGQSVLLSRRLVESGVEFVQVNWFRGPDEPAANPCWDSHADETNRLKDVLVPPLDQALTALLGDLEDRGLLDETVVAVLSEFGRTPRFNGRAGRDHWGHVFSIALAGGGIQGGVVYGVSDEQAAYPKQDAVAPEDVTATIFHALGYDPHTPVYDITDRAHPISRGGPIRAIL
ncbi:MAG: DUF1501 domain-containing protein [Planctomycetota bacterium]|nr:MAG: DUF1501 domain-containing protein [Planctomycetota bacterium]REJ93153.1 MAG: DUF1501 domain-containing protein [Planctomycetota bacterium]REK30128.1 MAG: DUF1501 domain-containing protein [Planctomycetota bacterium]REK37764.1 MAG: DUF1501 domain-containing protein [Planctomycetota bacterium]